MTVMQSFLKLLWRYAHGGSLPGDSDKEQVKKAVLTLVSGMIAFLAIFWGSLYVALGFPLSGAIPLSYAVITFTSIGILFAYKNFKFFRFSQLLLILFLPFILQWSLGGLINGSVVMIWAFFAPLAAMFLDDLGTAFKWLLAFIVLTVVSGLLDPLLTTNMRHLPHTAIIIFFVINLVACFPSIYLVLQSFVSDREATHQAVLQAKLELEKINSELQKSNETVQELMLTDSLTGIANRRHLDKRLLQELERMRRYDRPFSLLMLDLDHFKLINDSFGHEAGDEVLREVAVVLKKNIRNTDFVARFGGEEFVIILPETEMAVAKIFAEKIRIAVGNNIVEAIGRSNSVSIGVATTQHHETPHNLIKRADNALYKAKGLGRNQVVVAEQY